MAGGVLRLLAALIHSCLIAQSAETGGLEVRVPPISRAVLGQDVTLECTFIPPHFSPHDLIIYWLKVVDTETQHTLYSFYHGREQWQMVEKEFVNRTWTMHVNTSHGDCGIVLSNVSIADGGMYRAFIKTNPEYGEGNTRLEVTAPLSPPHISASSVCTRNKTALYRLTCTVSGVYPAATVRWHTDLGEDRTSQALITNRSTDTGLFNIISELEITGRSNRNYICSVSNPLLTPSLNVSRTLPDSPCDLAVVKQSPEEEKGQPGPKEEVSSLRDGGQVPNNDPRM